MVAIALDLADSPFILPWVGNVGGHDEHAPVMMDERTREIMRSIGERIRARRFDRGLSQTQLARHVGVTLQQIQKYETAKNRLPVDRLVRIAEVLDTPVSHFTDAATQHKGPDTRAAVNRQSMELVRHFQHIPSPRVRSAVIGLLRGLDAEAARHAKTDPSAPEDGDGDHSGQNAGARPSERQRNAS
ncbi:Transcriptional regulator, contains XRE-family HTH domain [Limimonas halophila]|uniref:Transcriptional regulator, contains XRE-family HTH domain n=1 Tax=Limimonas halophila TaxID=1082479 RepID=A0A1G7TZJ1_9PROT|nr:helix-turn-helix domain-containing protein [Limimonas halophila]SDG40501.1 Transcriptional regulator, contains XRE-family HTH domain [Limimonas halophila]